MGWNPREVTSHHPCWKSYTGFGALCIKSDALTLAREAWYTRPQLPLGPPDPLALSPMVLQLTMAIGSPATLPACDSVPRPPLCRLPLFIRPIPPAPFQSSPFWPQWQSPLFSFYDIVLYHLFSGHFCPGASSCWLAPVSPKWEPQERRDFSFLFSPTCASGPLPGRWSVNSRHLVGGQ